MVIAGDFKNGITFEMDGQVLQVIEFQHVKPGKGAAFVLFLLTLAAVLYAIFMFQDGNRFCGLLMFALAICLTVFAIRNLVRPSRTRYEVSFDENYPVSELIENYEIMQYCQRKQRKLYLCGNGYDPCAGGCRHQRQARGKRLERYWFDRTGY